MNYTAKIILLLVLLVAGAAFFYWNYTNEKDGDVPVLMPDKDTAGLANPASVYCEEEMAGDILFYEDEVGNVAGYCLLPNVTLCEEWKLFNSNGVECVAPGPGEKAMPLNL